MKTKKKRRVKVNFSISESAINTIDKFVVKNSLNKSKLAERLILEHMQKNSA